MKKEYSKPEINQVELTLQEKIEFHKNLKPQSVQFKFQNQLIMKQQFAIKALNKILELQEKYFKLKELGVDLIDYDYGINLLEESIAITFTNNESDFDQVLNSIQWWLYEDVDKVLTFADNSKVDLSKAEDFVAWLETSYATNYACC